MRRSVLSKFPNTNVYSNDMYRSELRKERKIITWNKKLIESLLFFCGKKSRRQAKIVVKLLI